MLVSLIFQEVSYVLLKTKSTASVSGGESLIKLVLLMLERIPVRECLTGGFLRAVSHESFVPLQEEQHTAPRD